MASVDVAVDIVAATRSTALAGSHQVLMTTNVSTGNESSMNHDIVKADSKVGKVLDAETSAPNPASPVGEQNGSAGNSKSKTPPDEKDSKTMGEAPPTPQTQPSSQFHMYSAATPQPISGYYLGYPNSQQTPEPPSPGPPYDSVSFFQPAAFAPHAGAFGHPGANTPLSPPRPMVATTLSGLPPPSPLFPRVGSVSLADSNQRVSAAPPSPALPYVTAPFAPSAYQAYAVTATRSSGSDDGTSWNDRAQAQQIGYQQESPQITSQAMYGVPLTRTGARAYSFEETMLPPPADQQDPSNPAYSPYSGSQTSAGGAFMAHQQNWMYGGAPDLYATPGSPLQPRPTVLPQAHMYGAGAMAGGMRPMGYPQYYPATSPGPPIQTTASNKGPDGANLFIFHIPNHFTNADMYQLFIPYGNLLSVRIMVEKETGRSRGFGFVSYDNPESAAMAIKELNGFAIGNKRLKVQHKQIRRDRENSIGTYGSSPGGSGDFARPGFPGSMPPPGTHNLWQENDPDGDGSGLGSIDGPSRSADESTGSAVGGDAAPGATTTATISNTNAAASTSDTPPSSMSPLASLGALQSALPEVPGNSD